MPIPLRINAQESQNIVSIWHSVIHHMRGTFILKIWFSFQPFCFLRWGWDYAINMMKSANLGFALRPMGLTVDISMPVWLHLCIFPWFPIFYFYISMISRRVDTYSYFIQLQKQIRQGSSYYRLKLQGSSRVVVLGHDAGLCLGNWTGYHYSKIYINVL